MTAPRSNAASYEIGYGKPPRRTQFKTGQSGNPGGRPRRRPIQRVKEMALQEAYRTVIVKEDGYAVPMSAIRSVLRSQLQVAADGNVRAQCAILAMIKDLEFDKALDAQFPHRVKAMTDAAADHDDVDYDDVGEPVRLADEMNTDEVNTDAETQQKEQPRSAASPSSADRAPPLENAAAPPAKSSVAKSPPAKSPAVKSPTRAAGGRVRKGAVARDTAAKRDTPSKRRARRERGRSARTAAARKAPSAPAASPGLQAGGTPALRPSVA
jgi:Family of unknown function (DUF5681)